MWVYQDSARHKCHLPRLDGEDISPGDTWQCDDCKALHLVVDEQRDGLHWVYLEPGSALRVSTLARLDRLGIDVSGLGRESYA